MDRENIVLAGCAGGLRCQGFILCSGVDNFVLTRNVKLDRGFDAFV